MAPVAIDKFRVVKIENRSIVAIKRQLVFARLGNQQHAAKRCCVFIDNPHREIAIGSDGVFSPEIFSHRSFRYLDDDGALVRMIHFILSAFAPRKTRPWI